MRETVKMLFDLSFVAVILFVLLFAPIHDSAVILVS
jgi:hypothetical protein